MYDGLALIALLNGSDTLVASFTHGPGIDDPLIARYAGNDYYFHKNHQGSVTEILNSSGAIAKTYKYDAFGNIVQETGPSLPGGFTYTGREIHPRSGLYYYRARFYDPRIGRFISPDPIGVLGGINIYAYVGNDPVNMIDSLGLCRKPSDPENWFYVFATREGLIGRVTATGHVIGEEDIFVALPSRMALGRSVELFYHGHTLTAPVLDVGPWNTQDPYWLTGGRPQAESGNDLRGRKTNKAGIDLSDKAFEGLGLTDNDWIYWRFKNE